jgi:hypothetical protein
MSDPAIDIVSFPTREQAREKREQERRGSLMPLPRTGGWAHVRSLSLADSATFAGLPMQATNEVLRVFDDLTREQGSAPLTMERLRLNQQRQERLANLVCCAGFIRPRLVMTEAELDGDPYTMLVTDLHLDERIRYLQSALSDDNSAVRSFRPLDGAAVGAVDPLPAVETPATPF